MTASLNKRIPGRLVLLTVAVFLALNLVSEAQEKHMLPRNTEEITFNEFVSTAEIVLPVKFFFRPEWVRDIRIGSYPDSTDLTKILESAFTGTTLHFYIEQSGNIIITDNYVIKVTNLPFEVNSNYMPAEDQPVPEENLQAAGIQSVELGNPSEKNLPGKASVSGYIINKVTREPLAGVTVYVQKLSAGTFTSDFGFYSLTLPRGIHLVRCSSVGMKEKQVSLTLNGSGDLNIEMTSVLIPLKELVVSADRNVVRRQNEVGIEKINMTSFKLLPTSMGEPDIIRNLLLLPGVQTVGEGSAGFNVRGGSADQNLILIYDAPVYNAFHFFGFFSAINSDIIRNVTLYKGGIPARYGGRVSSVLDIATSEGNQTKFSGTAGISPIMSHLMYQGPVAKDKLSFIIAGRTTYSNYILGLINDPAVRNSRANFYDINGKLTWEIDRKNKIDISSYYSFDSFRFNSDTLYRYSNRIISAKWRHFFTNRFFSSITLSNSYYNYSVSSHSSSSEAFSLFHSISSTSIKSIVNWFLGKNEANFGFDLTHYVVSPGTYKPYNDISLIIPRTILKESGVEGGLFVEDKYMLTDKLSASLGLRVSSFFALGPQKVMIYNPSFTRSDATIIDTLTYRAGSVIKNYPSGEIRAALNYGLNVNRSVKLNYNRTSQNLHLLSNTISIAPTDVWKLSDYYVRPEIGNQVAAGYYELLPGKKMEFSAEIYYKWIRNMIDFKGGTNLVMDDNIEKDIIGTKGKAYGLELTFKKSEGKVQYSISYTYSRVFTRSTGTFRDEIINSGKWFPANYDKPNDLIFTFNYIYSRRFSFSSSYTWSSGRPVTDPVSTYFMFRNVMIHYSDRNKYRIPDYSRLDLSMKISGNLKSRRIVHPNWIFSVYNLFGRENVYSEYFRNIDDFIKGYKLSVFGKAIPTVTFSFDF